MKNSINKKAMTGISIVFIMILITALIFLNNIHIGVYNAH